MIPERDQLVTGTHATSEQRPGTDQVVRAVEPLSQGSRPAATVSEPVSTAPELARKVEKARFPFGSEG